MRYALSTAPQNCTWADLLDVWRTADQLDVFESAWTFDHFEPIFSDRTGPCLDGWITMTALAQATQRLRLGCMVTGVVYRHPAVLAKMAATLDHVSGGRLELGLGAAWNTSECDAFGIELGSLRQRFDRFTEALTVIDSLLTRTTTNFDGAYFQLRNAYCEPKPVQSPRPPICIGGEGERRTIPLVAQFADHWNAGRCSIDDLPRKVALLDEHCSRIGRDRSEITISVSVLGRGRDVAEVTDEALRYGEIGVDLAVISLSSMRASAVEQLATALS